MTFSLFDEEKLSKVATKEIKFEACHEAIMMLILKQQSTMSDCYVEGNTGNEKIFLLHVDGNKGTRRIDEDGKQHSTLFAYPWDD
ncbi:CLUMA_CG019860, isoform A [Clunio marinus]|uniref:CLUMA_CG019860, isoform A n=1 Tax=Clunio marinus TaxID=568069 RepID=A0A1J1J2K8_9DIPT|nr:CLUMA_CG019860, isoform A [Clunio marinus]